MACNYDTTTGLIEEDEDTANDHKSFLAYSNSEGQEKALDNYPPLWPTSTHIDETPTLCTVFSKVCGALEIEKTFSRNLTKF